MLRNFYYLSRVPHFTLSENCCQAKRGKKLFWNYSTCIRKGLRTHFATSYALFPNFNSLVTKFRHSHEMGLINKRRYSIFCFSHRVNIDLSQLFHILRPDFVFVATACMWITLDVLGVPCCTAFPLTCSPCHNLFFQPRSQCHPRVKAFHCFGASKYGVCWVRGATSRLGAH